jgi:propionyl-CoA carboxylase alpha chain
VTYRAPQEGVQDGVTVRNDTGVGEGGEISIFYDPMIAKLVTHAPTREQAIDAQATALDAFAIDGIRHNIPFLAALMQHPRWREGRLSTGFIAEEFPGRVQGAGAHGRDGLAHGRGGSGGRSPSERAEAPDLGPAAGGRLRALRPRARGDAGA